MQESRVYLKQLSTGQLVEASLLDEVTDRHLALWSGAWQSALQAYCASRALRDKPEDHHWDWK
jgi:Zn/Cd-binding protein ZinT